MNGAFVRLTSDLASREFEVWNRAFSEVALLIERHALDKYDDSSYKDLLSDKALVDFRLGKEDYDHLIANLIDTLKNEEDRAANAAWALGKTYDKDTSRHLCEALEQYLQADNDEVVYQLIIALENCGIDDAGPLLTKISEHSSLIKSSEYAQQVMSVHF